MKANELMIGDWVICHHPTCEPKQIQVNAGLLNGLERQDLGFQTEESPLFRIVEPIPLTTEILKKNGWWLGEEEYHIESLNATIKQNYYFGNGYTIRYDSDNKLLIERGFDNGEMELQYVHELQHALKLCGIDKNIEL